MATKTVHELLDAAVTEDRFPTEADRNGARVLLLRLLESEGLLIDAQGGHAEATERPLLLGSMYVDHAELGWSMLVDTASIVVSFLGGGVHGTIGAGLATADLARAIWKNCMRLSARQVAIVAHLRRSQEPASLADLATAVGATGDEIMGDVTGLTTCGLLNRDSESQYSVNGNKLRLL